jgi:hypothetical protein
MTDVETSGVGPVEQTATLQPTTEPSPSLESGNEGSLNSSQETESVDWKKRYSDSSREVARIKEETENLRRQAEEAQSELLNQITKTREDYEEYIDKKELSPAEKEYYMNIYDTKIAPSKLTSRQVTEPSGTPSPSNDFIPQQADPIREAWMNRLDSQEREKWQTQVSATRDFFGKEENRKLPLAVQESIRATAAMLDQEYGYKPVEALEVAKRRILDPESIRDEGYTEGIRDSMTGGITRGFSGGSAKSEETIKLPARDEAFIQAEALRKGLKGDAVNEFRRKYAERLAQKR